ncbi:hypothetical protein NSTCB13_00851 [Nostoc sp. DSM 114160]|jgi:hypothetical protein
MGTKRVESTSIEVFMGDRNSKKYKVKLNSDRNYCNLAAIQILKQYISDQPQNPHV